MNADKYTSTHTHTHTRMQTYYKTPTYNRSMGHIPVHIMFIHTCVCIYICKYTCTHIHAHTHMQAYYKTLTFKHSKAINSLSFHRQTDRQKIGMDISMYAYIRTYLYEQASMDAW